MRTALAQGGGFHLADSRNVRVLLALSLQNFSNTMLRDEYEWIGRKLLLLLIKSFQQNYRNRFIFFVIISCFTTARTEIVTCQKRNSKSLQTS